MDLTLYGYWRSSCSWRVRIALNWKGMEYRQVPVHLVKDGGQQHSADYRKKNPMREVPTLRVDDIDLAQSMAILEYLEETCPNPSLLPKDAIGRAHVRQMAEIINSGIQPIQNLRVMQKLGRDFDLEKAQQMGWSHDWIDFGFEGLNQLVERHGGQFAYGDAVSFADVCLIPQLYNARRFQVDLNPYPKLLAVESACARLPAFVDADPSNQPDAQL